MFEPRGCTAPQLVYWGAAYSQAELLPWNRDAPAIQTRAYVNGKSMLAELDSGAEVSLVDTSAAAAVGVTRPAADIATDTIRGAGPRPEEAWTGRFDSFALGDEHISHVNISVLNVMRGMSYTETGSNMVQHLENTPSMYIGADFLHAHRVFIDNEDHLILFSYQGGSVFSAAKLAATSK